MRETHAIFAGYYQAPRDVDEVIALVGLQEKADARVKSLSGGQKRRLDLGIALVGDPDLVFLDEPTTGFDPQARRAAWEMIRSLRSLGKTVLLTTHYLDEAEQLADRVAVMREGQIVRVGTPRELTSTDLETEIRYRQNGEEVLVQTDEPTRVLAELTAAAVARGEELEGLQVRRPSLEEVYLALTAERTRSRHERRRDPRRHPPAGAPALRPPAPRGAARLLAQPRGRVLHLPLPATALRPARRPSTRGRSTACRAPEALLAGLIGYGCANTAFAGLAIQLVLRRESGILKRLRSTPLPPATYVAALLVSTLIVFALQTLALFLLGRALYGTPFPADVASFIAAIVIGAAVFAALGTATASVIRSAEGSSAVVNFILLPMAFLSGLVRADTPLSRRSCARSATCCRSSTSSTSSTPSICAVTASGRARKTSPSSQPGGSPAWSSRCCKFRWEPRER